VYITQPNNSELSTGASGVPIEDSVWPELFYFFSPRSLIKLCLGNGLMPLRFFSHTAAEETLRDLSWFIYVEYALSPLEWIEKLWGASFGETGNWSWSTDTNRFLLAREA
jgi:hypothetical protein